MNRTSLRFFAALGLCAAMATGTARAQDKSKGVWDIHRNRQQQPAATQPQPGVLDHGRVRNTRPVVTTTTPANQPAGWDRGRKTGWGSCDVPPGHAKPANCRPVHHDRRWVQRRDHRWEERREAERREARRRTEHRAIEHRAPERREVHKQVERREVHKQAERRHERVEMARKGHHDRH